MMPTKEAFSPQDGTTGGPYSPALAVGDQVYIAGQGPLSPKTNEIEGDTFEEQVERTFTNVQRALEAAGCSLDDSIKVTVYLSDMANYDRFNELYKTKFAKPYPVRTTVQAILWHHIQVEIDVIAVRGCGKAS